MAQELNINAAMGAVNLFMSAVKGCRLYPETSAIVKNSLDSGYKRLVTVFYRDTPFLISEADGTILFDGKPLDPRAQRMPQIDSLRGLMENLNLKSIAFNRGIDSANYAKFAKLLSMPPEEIDALGGIREMMDTEGVSFVVVNHKVYIQADSDSVIEDDQELFRQVWSDQIVDLPAASYIEKRFSHPQWLGGLGEGISDFISDKGLDVTDSESVLCIARLFGLVTRVALNYEIENAYAKVFDHLEALGPFYNSDLFALNIDEASVKDGIGSLSVDQFDLLAARLLVIRETQRRGSRFLGEENFRLYQQAAQWLVSSDRAVAERERIDALVRDEREAQKREIERIERFLEKVLRGDLSSLSEPSVQAAIPRVIADRIQVGKFDDAEALIAAVSAGVSTDDKELSEAAVRSLLQSTRTMIMLERRDLVNRAISPVNFWLRFQNELSSLYESVTDVIVNHVHHLITVQQLDDAVPFFETFSLMVQGRLKKGELITQHAGRTLKRMASERIFGLIMGEFRKSDEERKESSCTLLVLMGEISVKPLLDLLRNSDTMAERIRIIGMLESIGEPILEEIITRIRNDTAWFYLRNLLKMLSEVGSEEHIDNLLELTTRGEDQVVESVITCVNEIGGTKRAHFFSKAIANVSNPVKVRLAMILSQLGGDDAISALSDILTNKQSGTSEEKTLVTQAALKALGEIGSVKGLPALQSVVDQKGLLGMSRFTQEQKSFANAMILKVKASSSKAKTAIADKADDNRMRITRDYIFHEEYAILEAAVDGLIQKEKKPDALKMLLLMVERSAREKDFERAGGYKARISEVDELALGEVVRAEEVIAQEKRFVDSGEYMETWKDFYESLSEEEASAFYYHLKNETFEVDAEVIRQGDVIDRLVFINSGTLKVTFFDGGKDTFLQELGKGDVAGYDAFFKTTVSTANVVALSRVNVGFLTREGLLALEEKHPEFLAKLKGFCGRFDNLSSIVQAKGVERRRYRRFETTGKVVLQLHKKTGEAVGRPFSGELLDISEGGIAVTVKSSGYAMARLILGRDINTLMRPEQGESFTVEGRVSSVNDRGDGNISIHIAFSHLMEASVLETFIPNA